MDIINEEIKDNIFFVNLDEDKKNKYNLAMHLVDSYAKSGFYWGLVPLLNQYLSKKSRKKMIAAIGRIYGIVVQKRDKNNTSREYDENQLLSLLTINWNSFIQNIKNSSIISNFMKDGYLNEKKVQEIGKAIVDEYDKEYGKIGVADKYLNIALNKNFDRLKDFPNCFKQDYWHDNRIKITNIKIDCDLNN